MYILFDMSYIIYFKIYAMKAWYRHTKKEWDEDKLSNEPPFLELLHTRTVKCIDNIIQQHTAESNTTIFMCFDGQHSTQWRRSILPQYKKNRENNPAIYKMFGILKENILQHYVNRENIYIIEHEELEADDIIHFCSHNYGKNTNNLIIIIANDHDYIPLLQYSNISIKNAKGNEMKCNVFPKHALQFKILMGDKSDNIPPVASRIGSKTALKFIENPNLLKDKLKNDKQFAINYDRNKQIIDNTIIPDIYFEWLKTHIIM